MYYTDITKYDKKAVYLGGYQQMCLGEDGLGGNKAETSHSREQPHASSSVDCPQDTQSV